LLLVALLVVCLAMHATAGDVELAHVVAHHEAFCEAAVHVRGVASVMHLLLGPVLRVSAVFEPRHKRVNCHLPRRHSVVQRLVADADGRGVADGEWASSIGPDGAPVRFAEHDACRTQALSKVWVANTTRIGCVHQAQHVAQFVLAS